MVTPGWDPTQQGTPAGTNQAGYGPQPPPVPQEQPGQAGALGQGGQAGQGGQGGQAGQVGQTGQSGQSGQAGQVDPAMAPVPAPAGGPVPPQYPMQPSGVPMGQPPSGYGQPAYGAPVPPQPYGPPGPAGPGGPIGPGGYGQPPYPPPPGFGRKSGNKGLLIGVCSVLAAALVGGGVYLALAGDDDDDPSSADSGGSGGTTTTQQTATATPEAAATVFLDALTKNDVSAAAKFACEEFRQDVLAVKPDEGVTFSYRILGTEKISDSMTHVRVNERFEKDGAVQEQGDQILILVKEDAGYRVCGEQQPELAGG